MFSRLDNCDSGGSYIIAEVGQNHQGLTDLAIEYVEKFSDLGANAVKFQIRNNKYLLDQSILTLDNSDNSFGATYGEHREFLELRLEDFLRIKDKCREKKS